MNREQLLAEALQQLWYHVIDLGDGVLTPGTYDMRPVLRHYGFPEDLSGKRVLDIGRSSGFFSFELERRGADVTATELPRMLDKDFAGGEFGRRAVHARWRHAIPDTADPVFGDRRDFQLAHTLLGSKVRPLSLKLDQLTLDVVGGEPFDLAFVGSVLNHVADPIAALRRILCVTRGQLIVANPYDAKDKSSIPRARLVGRSGAGLTTWWVPNLTCLEEMLWSVGFEDVRVHSTFDLQARNGRSVPHAVLHATAPSDTPETNARWQTLEAEGMPRPPWMPETDRERKLADRVAFLEQESAERLAVIRRLEARLSS